MSIARGTARASRRSPATVPTAPDTAGETVAEPFLVREGFIVRTPRGRAASPLAWQHLGLTPPPSATHAAQALPLPLIDSDGRFGG